MSEQIARDTELRFGQRVRELRRARGWTQADLAQRLAAAGSPMHQSTVAKIESATRPTPVGEVANLAGIFGEPVAGLLGDELDPFTAALATARWDVVGAMGSLAQVMEREAQLRERLTLHVENLRAVEDAARAADPQVPGLAATADLRRRAVQCLRVQDLSVDDVPGLDGRRPGVDTGEV